MEKSVSWYMWYENNSNVAKKYVYRSTYGKTNYVNIWIGVLGGL